MPYMLTCRIKESNSGQAKREDLHSFTYKISPSIWQRKLGSSIVVSSLVRPQVKLAVEQGCPTSFLGASEELIAASSFIPQCFVGISTMLKFSPKRSLGTWLWFTATHTTQTAVGRGIEHCWAAQ
jgi:hypothetical protein